MASYFGFEASDKEGYYFVSYNTEDAPRVAEICGVLHECGMQLWYDEGIAHNEHWESVLAEKIDKCEEVIFFITKNIFEKGKTRNISDIYTYREYDLARRYKKKRLIVLLDEIDDSDVPYSLMSWWQEIDPRSVQGILSYEDEPAAVADKILSELGLKSKNEHLIDDDIRFPLFNSVINHPDFGDEREFVHIRQWGSEEWKRSIRLLPGRQYEVDILFRNDANPEYNTKQYEYRGVAVRSRVAVDLPRSVVPGRENKLCVKILFGTREKSRTDAVVIHLDDVQSRSVRYVSGSAKIYNRWKTNGWVFPSNLFSFDGALLGLNTLNGLIPGGDEYAGHIRFVFEVSSSFSAAEYTVNYNI